MLSDLRCIFDGTNQDIKQSKEVQEGPLSIGDPSLWWEDGEAFDVEQV